MKKGLRRVAVVAVSTLVAIPAMANVAGATSTFSFDRLQGQSRYDTSAAVGTAFGASTSVILANGTDAHTVDALTAGYLAGVKAAPIMLTQLDTTPTKVLDRITASGATTVYIVGGENVISLAQEAALDAKFGTVTRLGGGDRYLTAQKVIGAGGTATTALLASGVEFPDALAAGALSYKAGMPIAITAPTTVPVPTMAALKAAGVTKVLTVGGTLRVAKSVLDELAAQGITAFTGAGVTDGRIAGEDRSQTSTLLADYMIDQQGFTNTKINVASGDPSKFGADALGGAALSGKDNTPTLITATTNFLGNAPGGIVAFLTARSATLASGHIFGGPLALTDALKTEMETAAKAVASNQTYSVTPTTTAVLPVDGGTAGTRTYTATVPAGTVVDIMLIDASNVTVTSGVVTFADGDSDKVADVITPAPIINLVNGIVNTTSTVDNLTSTGTITFSVTSVGSATVLPVVFADSLNDDVLNLVVPTTANDLSKQPSDAFGIGGITIFTQAEAPLGTTTVTVGVADTTNNFYANGATYYYDANDVFQYSGIGITLAQFESILSSNDVVTAIYNPDAAGVSTFSLTTDAIGT